MKQINSPQDFEAMLRTERALVFIFFPWSDRAIQSREIVEAWQEQALGQGEINYSAYELAPDDHAFSWIWVNGAVVSDDEVQSTSGSVVWLRQGSMVAFVPCAARAGVKNLASITSDCFVANKTYGRGSFADLQEKPAPFDTSFLQMLCCPETHQPLALAEAAILEKVNQRVLAGNLRNRSGNLVEERIEDGFVRADGRYLYPLRRNIPILLVDEAVPLA